MTELLKQLETLPPRLVLVLLALELVRVGFWVGGIYTVVRLCIGRFVDAKSRYWEIECLLEEEKLRHAQVWKRPVGYTGGPEDVGGKDEYKPKG